MISPSINTGLVRKLVEETLKAKGVIVTRSGQITIDDVQKFHLFDKQYNNIARYALSIKPQHIYISPASRALFYDKFGLSWQDAILNKEVFNTVDMCMHLSIELMDITALWVSSERNGKVIQLDDSIYCGMIRVQSRTGSHTFYCINGFYPQHRQEYTTMTCGSSVHYFSIEWEESEGVDWKQLHCTFSSPSLTLSTCADDSHTISDMITQNWQQFELKSEPSNRNRLIHFSASAFEALVERTIWLKSSLSTDPFGFDLISAGLSLHTLLAWMDNPEVDGKSVFSHMNGLGAKPCIEVAMQLAKGSTIFIYRRILY